MNVVQSLALTKKIRVESIPSREGDTVSVALSDSTIQEGMKHGQIHFIQSFIPNNYQLRNMFQ